MDLSRLRSREERATEAEGEMNLLQYLAESGGLLALFVLVAVRPWKATRTVDDYKFARTVRGSMRMHKDWKRKELS